MFTTNTTTPHKDLGRRLAHKLPSPVAHRSHLGEVSLHGKGGGLLAGAAMLTDAVDWVYCKLNKE